MSVQAVRSEGRGGLRGRSGLAKWVPDASWRGSSRWRSSCRSSGHDRCRQATSPMHECTGQAFRNTSVRNLLHWLGPRRADGCMNRRAPGSMETGQVAHGVHGNGPQTRDATQAWRKVLAHSACACQSPLRRNGDTEWTRPRAASGPRPACESRVCCVDWSSVGWRKRRKTTACLCQHHVSVRNVHNTAQRSR